MAELINYNSAVIFGLVIILVGAFVMIRRGIEPRRVVTFGVLVVLVIGAFFSLRPSVGTDASAGEIRTVIGGGTPVLLEFQSQN